MSTLEALLQTKKDLLKALEDHVKPANLSPAEEVAFDIKNQQMWNDYYTAKTAYNHAIDVALENRTPTNRKRMEADHE